MFGKTFGKIFVAGTFLVMAFAGNANAQSPTRLDQFSAWGSYSYKSGDTTICYVLSAPLTAEPTTVDHGDNFFLVSKRATNPVSFETQFMAGYSLQEGSKVIVNVDGTNFEFFTKNASAWLVTPTTESQLIAAMRKGSKLTVNAVSKRGTKTSYSFSLKGITAALNAIQNCK